MSPRSLATKAKKKTARPASKPPKRKPPVPAAARKPATMDDYLARVTGNSRVALDKLRGLIRKAVPDAEECISYAVPAFRLHGTVIAGFAATRAGCSYFPFSGSTLATLGEDLRGYDKTKSALHFSPDKPLPARLVRKLLKARIDETRG